MFELSVACKYLIPRWRQLSVSIISLVSTLVIALVVWLIVVFFSVKDGLENSWIEKIIALTAPVRITPTEKYYQSYYYLADTISSESDYTSKSIGEKLTASRADPYDPEIDEEIPRQWPLADRSMHGDVKDLVKEVFRAASSLTGVKDLKISDYETTFANVRLRLLRRSAGTGAYSQQFMEHAAYIGSIDSDTPALVKTLLPITAQDLQNLIYMQGVSSDNIPQESPDSIHQVEAAAMQERLQQLFGEIEVVSLKTPQQGWRIPSSLLPKSAKFLAVAVFKNNDIIRVLVPSNVKSLPQLLKEQQMDGASAVAAEIGIENGEASVKINGKEDQFLSSWTLLFLEGNTEFSASLDESSLRIALKPQDIRFTIRGKIQRIPIQGEVSLGKLEIGQVKIKGDGSSLFAMPAADKTGILLPQGNYAGDPVLLPRNFKDAGALIGDQGYLSYYSPTPSTLQEQRIPIFVAGFYDPGIMSIGGKYILADKELTGFIRASYNQNDALVSNGINIQFANLTEAPRVKADLVKALQKDGLAPYWQVETYQEYEFTKDLIQQLRSEKNLFSLISLIIIIVACSNIISMLIILVNDKKLEIGILRSMGASSLSIAVIFGFCGMVMGMLGSCIGIIAALITLRNVNELVGFISHVQGYDLFNPVFYGNTLPTELSFEALMFVMATTALISLIAGIVPAVKASLLRPSAILRAE